MIYEHKTILFLHNCIMQCRALYFESNILIQTRMVYSASVFVSNECTPEPVQCVYDIIHKITKICPQYILFKHSSRPDEYIKINFKPYLPKLGYWYQKVTESKNRTLPINSILDVHLNQVAAFVQLGRRQAREHRTGLKIRADAIQRNAIGNTYVQHKSIHTDLDW